MITDNDAGYENYHHKTENADPAQTGRELFSRYMSMLAPIYIPDVTLLDVKRLSTALGDEQLPRGMGPRDHLIASIDRHLHDLTMQGLITPVLVTDQDRRDPAEKPSEVPNFEALRGKVGRWTPLQCMKAIEALECLRARDRLPVEVTPATVHMLLRGETGKPKAKKAKRPKPEEPVPWSVRVRGLFNR